MAKRIPAEPMKISFPTGRHNSSGVSPVIISFPTGRHNSSNIPATTISFPTGRHNSSNIAPLDVSQFNPNLKSDIAPLNVSQFNPNLKSDIAPINVSQFNPNLKSDIAPLDVSQFNPNLKSDIAPLNVSQFNPNLKSDIPATNLSPQTGRHEAPTPAGTNLTPQTGRHLSSDTAPINSTLGANNQASNTPAQNLTPVRGRHLSSDTAPLNSTLGANNQTSNTAPLNSTLGANNQVSDTAPINSLLSGRHESSDTAPENSTLTGRHESSDIAPENSTLTGRHDSSDIAPDNSTLTGRHDSSDTAPVNSTLTGRHESSDIDSSATTPTGRHESSDTAPINSILGANNESSDIAPINSTLTGRHESSDTAPINSTLTGRHESSDIDSSPTTPDGRHESSTIDDGPTTPTGRHESSTIDDTPTTPDGRHESSTIDTTSGIQTITNARMGQFDTAFNTGEPSKYGGISGQEFTYPDNSGLGLGTIGTPVNYFDDNIYGSTGFTLNQTDTQFLGIDGSPGTMTYTYPDTVQDGRLMYNGLFRDAAGIFTSHIEAQVPINPSITINSGFGPSFNLYNAEPASIQGIVPTDPGRPNFNGIEGNKYGDLINNFTTDITINDSHPKSFLAEATLRDDILGQMEMIIPATTGPSGVPDGVPRIPFFGDTKAKFNSVEGNPNYFVHKLSYADGEISSQIEGYARKELQDQVSGYDYNKSLIYGHDLRFGGTGDDPTGIKESKEPYILRDIGQTWGLGGSTFDEGAFRGGFVTLTNRGLQDVVRLGKSLIDNPIKGVLWFLKQVGLQASNPRVETDMTFLGRRTRVFLPINMLATVATGHFGIRFKRHGLIPLGIGEGNSDYEAAVDAHNVLNDGYDSSTPAGSAVSKGKGAGNTLIALKDDLILSDDPLGAGGFLGIANLLGIKGQKIDRLSDDVFGGPKSLYGIGGTTIRRYENQTNHIDGKGLEYENTEGKFAGPQIAKYLVSSYGITADNAKKMADGGTSHNDFRKDLKKQGSNFTGTGLGKAADYEKNNLTAKFGFQDYKDDRDRADYRIPLNMDDYMWKLNGDEGKPTAIDTHGNKRDLVKLVMEDIYADKQLRFRSYISGFSDNITPNWSDQKYIGRADKVYHYGGAERAISFGLMVVCMSRQELLLMYKKVNYLIGLCYPHYADEGTSATPDTMIGPLIKLTLGDYLYRTSGFLSSVTIAVDENSPWEINLEEMEDVAQLPKFLNIQLGFTPIGSTPKTTAFGEIVGRHIGPGTEEEMDAGHKDFFEQMAKLELE